MTTVVRRFHQVVFGPRRLSTINLPHIPSSTPLSLSAQILCATSLGISIGLVSGKFIATALGEEGLNLFTYTPDDDDDNEEDNADKSIVQNSDSLQHRSDVFADFRLGVLYRWSSDDNSSEGIPYRKEMLQKSREELDALIVEKKLKDLDLKEANLAKKFLLDQLEIEKMREKFGK